MYKDNFRPDYIVGLARGGLVPAVKLSHYLDIPIYALNKEETQQFTAPALPGLYYFSIFGSNLNPKIYKITVGLN